MKLQVLSMSFVVCQLPKQAVSLATPPSEADFWSLTVTGDEVSLVCDVASLPADVSQVEHGWCALKIQGVLDFGMVGVIAKISALLAAAEISIFVVSTFNTDYVLVKDAQLHAAVAILRDAAYEVEAGD